MKEDEIKETCNGAQMKALYNVEIFTSALGGLFAANDG